MNDNNYLKECFINGNLKLEFDMQDLSHMIHTFMGYAAKCVEDDYELYKSGELINSFLKNYFKDIKIAYVDERK